MKNIILLMHVSLDGFVAGPNGEMDFIQFDEAMFANVDRLHPQADTAIYGRKTFDMMEPYWPVADESPNATQHTKNHANWYRNSLKLVVSNNLKAPNDKTKVIAGDLVQVLQAEKEKPGKDILMIGSPSIVHQMAAIIDEYWLYVNPVILGNGIPLFKAVQQKINLKLVETLPFKAGVLGLHYKKA